MDGRQVLQKIIDKYGGLAPEEIAGLEGLDIYDCPNMPSNIESVYVMRTIVIPDGLDKFMRQWLISRCLGYHFAEDRQQFWLYHKNAAYFTGFDRFVNLVATYLMVNHLSPHKLQIWAEMVGDRPVFNTVMKFVNNALPFMENFNMAKLTLL